MGQKNMCKETWARNFQNGAKTATNTQKQKTQPQENLT